VPTDYAPKALSRRSEGALEIAMQVAGTIGKVDQDPIAKMPEAERSIAWRLEGIWTSERTVWELMAMLVVYVIIRGLVTAATTPFFSDEVLTSVVASLPSLSAKWHALAEGVDGQPPFFYMIEKAASTLTQNRHIALRLPGIFAMPCTSFAYSYM
jgi:hypothetical protein